MPCSLRRVAISPGGGGGAALTPPPRAPPPAAKIQNDLRILTERLARLNDNLARKIASRNEYDKTIQETEGAYAKVRPLPLLPSHLATRPPIPS